ncbi:MAG: hypothetical protein JSS81_01245 [Acidobacteria bacterium]|nr:hypothetical protein [Acidobacteriota bacterium]
MPLFVYKSNTPETVAAESGIKVTAADGSGPNGKRLLFQSHANWVKIPGAGQIGHATGSNDGIYTVGQLQCMAIIVARFTHGAWTEAHLAHVSYAKHSLVGKLFDDHAKSDSFVAIGGKFGSIKWMEEIAERFEPAVAGVWIYTAGKNSPDFGMNKNGFFGETVSWKSATPDFSKFI